MENKILTWKNLRKGRWIGLGCFRLYKREEDSVDHMFLSCVFSKIVWALVAKDFKTTFDWRSKWVFRFLEMNIFGNWQAQKPKIFIHLIPVSCFVYNMIWLYLGVHYDSVESFGTQLNLHVPLPLLVIERSKRIHRIRSHFSAVANAVKVFRKNLQKHKMALQHRTTCTFQVFIKPILVNQASFID